MTVDIFGQSCDIKSILKIAKKNNLKVISILLNQLVVKVERNLLEHYLILVVIV